MPGVLSRLSLGCRVTTSPCIGDGKILLKMKLGSLRPGVGDSESFQDFLHARGQRRALLELGSHAFVSCAKGACVALKKVSEFVERPVRELATEIDGHAPREGRDTVSTAGEQ